MHATKLNAIIDPGMRQRRLAELNAIEQSINIYKTAVVRKELLETCKNNTCTRFPRIYPLLLDPKTGFLKSLQVNSREIISSDKVMKDLLYTLTFSAFFQQPDFEKTIKTLEGIYDLCNFEGSNKENFYHGM